MTADLFLSFKLQFDIKYQMNPMLAALPYDHEEYNQAYRELMPDFLMDDLSFRNIHLQAQDARRKAYVFLINQEERQARYKEIEQLREA